MKKSIRMNEYAHQPNDLFLLSYILIAITQIKRVFGLTTAKQEKLFFPAQF